MVVFVWAIGCFLCYSWDCSSYAIFNFRSSISDSGIGMICNVFPKTLSRLLLALCPNITSSNLLSPALYLMQCSIIVVGIYNFTFGFWLMSVCFLPVSFRWNPICNSSIASSPTHGLWNDHLWSQFSESNLWRKWWLRIAENSQQQTAPYLPEANYQTWQAEKTKLVGLFWLRCEFLN